MPKNFSNQQLMHQVASIMPHYCDRCGNKHEKTDLEIINFEAEKLACRLECSNCKNIYIFQVTTTPEGVINTKKNSVKLDVSAQELKKFTDVDEIISEEILDVVISLKSINTIEDFKNQITVD